MCHHLIYADCYRSIFGGRSVTGAHANAKNYNRLTFFASFIDLWRYANWARVNFFGALIPIALKPVRNKWPGLWQFGRTIIGFSCKVTSKTTATQVGSANGHSHLKETAPQIDMRACAQ